MGINQKTNLLVGMNFVVIRFDWDKLDMDIVFVVKGNNISIILEDCLGLQTLRFVDSEL
ncbi:hypothetical protein [Sediminicola sp. 1XM1-17]|uniref:hypothetical protein n=1 Tax=Sediminicola sp. 1XM1-17 TaxID=3127702 RepID=UPI003077E2FC